MPRRISREVFERLVDGIRLTDGQRERASKVLVEGRPVREVARDEGISDEAVRLTCRRLVGRLRGESPTLTEPMFAAAADRFPRMSARNRELARRVLVDEQNMASVAQDAEISVSVLARVVRNIRDAAVPDGWRVVNVVLPAEEADRVEARAEEVYDDLIRRQRRS